MPAVLAALEGIEKTVKIGGLAREILCTTGSIRQRFAIQFESRVNPSEIIRMARPDTWSVLRYSGMIK